MSWLRFRREMGWRHQRVSTFRQARRAVDAARECPYSHMEDGSHDLDWHDGGICSWCGDRKDDDGE